MKREYIKSLALLIVGVAALVIYIAYAIDVEKFLRVISGANALFALSILCAFTATFLYSYGWHILLKDRYDSVSFKKVYVLTTASIYLNLVIPSASASGEAFRIYESSKSLRDSSIAVSTILLHRLFMFIPFVTGAFVGCMYLNSIATTGYASKVLLFSSIILVVAFIFFTVLIVKPSLLSKPIGKMYRCMRRDPSKITKMLIDMEKNMRLHGKATLAKLLVVSFLYWLVDNMILFFALASLGVYARIELILLVYAVTVLIQTIPIGIPGMIGVVDVVRTELFMVAGIPREIGISASILTDIAMVFFLSLYSFIFYVLQVGKFRGCEIAH